MTGPAPARVFGVLWGLAAWVHLWNHDVPGMLAPNPSVLVAWALNVAVIALVASGGAGAPLLIAATLQIAHVLLTMPEAADHWMLVAAGNTVLLASAAASRSWSVDRVLDGASGSLRALILVCYGAAAIAKFNTGFLDVERSCATQLARLSAQFVPLGPDVDWMHRLHIGGALVAEGSVALLLVVPRTRRLGLTIGVLFHFLISFTPAVAVFDFTATLLAFWWLFTPEGTTDRLRALAGSLAQRYAELAPHAASLASAAVIALGGFTLIHHLVPAPLALAVRTLAFDGYGLVACTLGLWAVWSARGQPDGSIRPTGVGIPVLVVALLDVAAPYAGLKSVGSFAMYSNLRTEDGVSNHLILPSVPLFPQLSDLAVIEASTDSWLAEIAAHGEALPMHELRRRSRGHAAPHAVTWTQRGERHVVERAADAPDLVPRAWESWLLVSRPVHLDGTGRCQN